MIDGQIPHASGLVVTVTLLVSDALLRAPVTLECPVQLIAERVPRSFRGVLSFMTLLGSIFVMTLFEIDVLIRFPRNKALVSIDCGAGSARISGPVIVMTHSVVGALRGFQWLGLSLQLIAERVARYPRSVISSRTLPAT